MILNNFLKKALKEKWSLGHFNVASFEQIKAIILAAKELNSPLMLGVSEGEREYLGLKQIVALIKSFREETGLPLFLNADHSKSVESAKKAIDAGFDSVHIDLSKLSFEETGIDRFAPVVGNIHGISANEPKLDIERIKALRKILPENVALVLHGGSGIPDEQIKKAIEAGISNIHINTEIRVVYAETLRRALAENPEETTPYKILPQTIEAMKEKVAEKIKLFGSEDKI